eukprot:9543839-Ditylum_brightwellii.AAC.2
MRKTINISCRKFATESNIDLYQDGFPHNLSKLSKVKEMLIACIYPVMKIYWLKGSMAGYKGDVLSIEEDIGGLLNSLPQRINQL